jgi:hypothetical protein
MRKASKKMPPLLQFDPNHFQTTPVRRLAAYWLSKCVGDRLPRRADIRPEEIAPDLPYIYLVDVLRDPLAFRFRLIGTQITSWSEKDYTGAAVSATEYGPQWKTVFDSYCEIVEHRTPTAAERFAPWRKREFQYYERFLAPLSEDGQTITMIYGALHTIKHQESLA